VHDAWEKSLFALAACWSLVGIMTYVVLDRHRDKARLRMGNKLLVVIYVGLVLGTLCWVALPYAPTLPQERRSSQPPGSVVETAPDEPGRDALGVLKGIGQRVAVGVAILAFVGVVGTVLWWPVCRLTGLPFADTWLIGGEIVLGSLLVFGIISLFGKFGWE
jgi:hypothetical protein